MKNIVLSAIFALLIVACVTNEAKNKKKDSCCSDKEASACCKSKEAPKACCAKSDDASAALKVSVDELYASPQKYLDKKVALSGLVVHTCKKSGKKMFLIGSNDSISVKVQASDKISKFEPSLEGNKVVASGIISVVTHDDHGHEHADGEKCASEGKGKNYILTCESLKTL